MIERIIENWVDKASEKAFQVPFCYILIEQGHTIIHMTRHCGMEHGKDIISYDREGNLCAFQLKGAAGAKIKLRDWKQEIHGQVLQLIFTPISHPSVVDNRYHRSYFVTNAEIEEEVSHAIVAFNQQHKDRNQPYNQLHTIVGGQMKNMAHRLGNSFMKAGTYDFKVLLEFLLEDGKGMLNKEKLAGLLELALKDEELSQNKYKEKINNAALLVSVISSNFTAQQNHFGIFEAWTMYLSYLMRFAERNQLAVTLYHSEYQLAKQMTIDSLEELWTEIQERKDFLTGNYLEDSFFHGYKKTMLLGAMSLLGLHHLFAGTKFDHHKLAHFIEQHFYETKIWGESAHAYTLCTYWYFKKVDATDKSAEFLKALINGIIEVNKVDGLANPYYGVEDCALHNFLNQDTVEIDKKHSYYLEGFINLLVLQNYKNEIRFLWRDISYFVFKDFRLNETSDFYCWRNKLGKEHSVLPKLKQEWQELIDQSKESEGKDLPLSLKNDPVLYPQLLLIMPHRSSVAGIRWFNSKLNNVG